MSAVSTATMVPASALAGHGTLVRFTADDVFRMMRQGMVPEDASTELLNGFIVHTDRATQGGDPTMPRPAHSPAHRHVVRRLTALAARIDSPDRHVQIQSPIICGPMQMPEPDFAIVQGSDERYVDRLPSKPDVFCVIEVADSSLNRDRLEKRPIYAAARIPQYIILNLRNRTAEHFRLSDDYETPAILNIEESVDLNVGPNSTFRVPLADLFPPVG